MKYFYLSMIIVFGQQLVFGQSNYKPGYILNLNGDTVKGYINYRDWGKNPSSVVFKKDLNSSPEQKYSVINSVGFALNGIEYYKRYIGKISQDQVETGYLKTEVDSTTKLDTVFLRVVSKGKNVTLYEYSDIIKTRFFISQLNKPAEELAFHAYLVGGDKVEKSRGYIKQLQYFAALYQPQNSALIDEISLIDYNVEGLKKIVFKINGADKGYTDGNSFTAESHSGARIFFGLGGNYSSVRFIGTNDFTTLSPSTTIFPAVNLGTDIYFNKAVGKLLIRINLNLTGNKVNFNYSGGGSFPYNTVLKFDQYIIALQPQLLYNLYNSKPFKFYVSAGGGANFASYKNLQYYRVNPNGTVTPSSTLNINQPVEPMSTFFNVVTTMGIVFNNKIDIYIGYQPYMAFDNEAVYSMQYASYSGGIRYLFGGK